MTSRNRYDGLDPAIVRNMRWHAGVLHRAGTLPAWGIEDYEQALAEALIRGSAQYEAARARYVTFASRVVENRARDLRREGRVRAGERDTVSLGGFDDDDGPAGRLAEADGLWPSPSPDPHLRLDLTKFLSTLSPALRRCWALLLEGNLSEAARSAGINRSTLYEARERLRLRATAAGLAGDV